MSATVAKPADGNRLSRAELRRRWLVLADDALVAAIPFKVELNEKCAIDDGVPGIHTTDGLVAASGLGFALLRLDDQDE